MSNEKRAREFLAYDGPGMVWQDDESVTLLAALLDEAEARGRASKAEGRTEERTRIVRWLREQAPLLKDEDRWKAAWAYEQAADDIERGRHGGT